MIDATYTITHLDADPGIVLDGIAQYVEHDSLHTICIEGIKNAGGLVSYTIGNYDAAMLPELVVVGPGPKDACAILTRLSEVLRKRG
jgi:hypothetical protein